MQGATPNSHQSAYYRSDSYLRKLEANFMRDFSCCGISHPSLQDLLQHFEMNHLKQARPGLNSEGIVDGGAPEEKTRKQGDTITINRSPSPNYAQIYDYIADSQEGLALPNESFGEQDDFPLEPLDMLTLSTGGTSPHDQGTDFNVLNDFYASHDTKPSAQVAEIGNAKYTQFVFDSKTKGHLDNPEPFPKGRRRALDEHTKSKQRSVKAVGACWRCKVLKKSVS